MLTENDINVGDQVIYRCPWTGCPLYGWVIQVNGEWGAGFYDIHPDDEDDNYLDTAIHVIDIIGVIDEPTPE
jgi:hypothetical protein